jgi:hypothetical protein
MSHQIDIDKGIHSGCSITKIEVSPNEKYLITYSEDDHSIFGWNIDGEPKPDKTYLKLNDKVKIKQICISDYKKLAYIYSYQGWNCLSKYFYYLFVC